MAETAASSGGGNFLGYSVGSGPASESGPTSVEYMDSSLPALFDMIHSGGGVAANNNRFGDYGLDLTARPRDSAEYGGPLEGLFDEIDGDDSVSQDFRAGMKYAIGAILGSYGQAANNNNHFPLTARASSSPVSRGYGNIVPISRGAYDHDSVASPIEPRMSRAPRMSEGRGRVIEFSDVQVFRKTTLRIWER
jgi:hypothetical protein